MKIVSKKSRRVGRGHGSGRVKTSGRGTKGQNARATMPIGFEGGQLAITRRLPFLRGKLRNKSMRVKPFALDVCVLNRLSRVTTVTLEELKKQHLVSSKEKSIKLVGNSTIEKAYTVALLCSHSAKDAIEKSGGTIHIPHS